MFGDSLFSHDPMVSRSYVGLTVRLFVEIVSSDCINMSSSPTGCCAVQWAMWKGGGLTSRDRLNSSENYLLLGFLLAMPSQTVLLLVRQSLT